MQFFSKKHSNSSEGFSPWHPNFRNKTELPDIKTVRTKFFVNVLFVLLAICGALFYAYQEYTVREIDKQILTAEAQVSIATKPSSDAILLYQKFLEEEAKIKELTSFLSAERLVFSDFLIAVGKAIPADVSVTTIQYRSGDVLIGGIVKGAPELASGVAASFEKQLKESTEINKKFKTISLTALNRDSKTEFLNFVITLGFSK